MRCSVKVFQAYYSYTETYGSPYESEHEQRDKVLVTTLDESLAREYADEYNKTNDTYWRHASVRSFELTER